MKLSKHTLERALSAIQTLVNNAKDDPRLAGRRSMEKDEAAIKEIEDALPFIDIEHDASEQMSRNVKWLIEQIDTIHNNLCPDHHGTWQQRAEQAVLASSVAGGTTITVAEKSVLLMSLPRDMAIGPASGTIARVQAALPGVNVVPVFEGTKVVSVINRETP